MEVEANKSVKKKTRQVSSYLDRTSFARSDSQSEDRIPFILPMGTAGDIMKAFILTARPSEDHWN